MFPYFLRFWAHAVLLKPPQNCSVQIQYCAVLNSTDQSCTYSRTVALVLYSPPARAPTLEPREIIKRGWNHELISVRML